MTQLCVLCNRPLDTTADEHHLIPKCHKGKSTILIHRICHDKIHHTFTEYELAKVYNTVEMLKTHDEINSFIKWVAKKPINFYTKTKDTKRRNSKR